MSKTPRTDEHLRMKEENGHAVIVSSDFSRQLERELADKDEQLSEARAEIERLKQLWSCNLDIIGGELNKQLVDARAEIGRKNRWIEQMREALENIRDYPGHIDYTTGEVHSMQEIAIAALTAEGGE